MTKTKFTYNKLMDALNRIDEFACDAIHGSSDAELEEYNDYNFIADFIKENTNNRFKEKTHEKENKKIKNKRKSILL